MKKHSKSVLLNINIPVISRIHSCGHVMVQVTNNNAVRSSNHNYETYTFVVHQRFV